ncbi:MAG: glutamine-hydrolyzing carbamoyl-phosphate synthase small subunit [Moraxellaceae bacterium]|nr:glutamine-hydrolyzing carbamoyl-phosphate synthase small subunit [Pseudobdellovibrionaceae bacterium]
MNYYLILEDGELFKGAAVGSQLVTANSYPEKAGEVVFNTAHSGYEEVATDPSYFNQIVVMTAPMQGNYGSTPQDWESSKMWINGFVCLQMQNSKRNSSWMQRLIDHQIPILTEIDTRTLTIKLRSQGTPWGALVRAETESEAQLRAQKLILETKKIDSDWVWLASRKEVAIIQGENPHGPKVAVLDLGAKENILRELKSRSRELRVYPSRTPYEVIEQWNPDALMLTNGPGDPSLVKVAVQTTKHFLGKIPIFGICMGHQILGQALGAKTYKLKFGHRGVNHPIRDNLLNRIYISSQNHGYAIDEKTLPSDVKITHVNLNDNTVAGFFSEKQNCLGIQYHPESHPGPHEAVELFNYFITVMSQKNKDQGRHANATTI